MTRIGVIGSAWVGLAVLAACGGVNHSNNTSLTDCNGSMLDTSSDPQNCGACGNVCNGSIPGCCSGVCSDLATDVYNCGACGSGCANLDCAGGTCGQGCSSDSDCPSAAPSCAPLNLAAGSAQAAPSGSIYFVCKPDDAQPSDGCSGLTESCSQGYDCWKQSGSAEHPGSVEFCTNSCNQDSDCGSPGVVCCSSDSAAPANPPFQCGNLVNSCTVSGAQAAGACIPCNPCIVAGQAPVNLASEPGIDECCWDVAGIPLTSAGTCPCVPAGSLSPTLSPLNCCSGQFDPASGECQ